MLETTPDTPSSGRASQKWGYFASLALSHTREFRTHIKYGLWERQERGGPREWGNVSEHCLVEAARAIEFARLLDLPTDVASDLATAATLHDAYKRREAELVRERGPSWAVFEEANRQAAAALRGAGYNERVVRLTGAVGHGSLLETEEVLSRQVLSNEDTAFLAMHYIDDYTIGSSWASPAEVVGGRLCNSLDFRTAKNAANPRYQQLNEDGLVRLGNRLTFDA